MIFFSVSYIFIWTELPREAESVCLNGTQTHTLKEMKRNLYNDK